MTRRRRLARTMRSPQRQARQWRALRAAFIEACEPEAEREARVARFREALRQQRPPARKTAPEGDQS